MNMDFPLGNHMGVPDVCNLLSNGLAKTTTTKNKGTYILPRANVKKC